MEYHGRMVGEGSGMLRMAVPGRCRLDRETEEKLRVALGDCPDLAFAHLAEVEVEGHEPNLVLFVWVVAPALRSIRSALNAVCRLVARTLPPDRFLDVVLLNPAPDILEEVERVGCLLVERNPEERAQALRALAAGASEPSPPAGSPWWWPF